MNAKITNAQSCASVAIHMLAGLEDYIECCSILNLKLCFQLYYAISSDFLSIMKHDKGILLRIIVKIWGIAE